MKRAVIGYYLVVAFLNFYRLARFYNKTLGFTRGKAIGAGLFMGCLWPITELLFQALDAFGNATPLKKLLKKP